MAFCKNCGAQLTGTERFCNNCGTPMVSSVQEVVYVKAKVPGRGFGISSMVLGIIGLVYSVYVTFAAVVLQELVDLYDGSSEGIGVTLIPILMYSVLSILSVCFAPAAMKRGYKNGVSVSGMVMGVLGMIGYIISVITIIGCM